jgi:O-antigen ligase
MHLALAALFFFAILTLWVPALWPVSIFETGMFALATVAVFRSRRNPPSFSFPVVPLSFAVLWGLFQLLSGRTIYDFDTEVAIVRWTTFLAVFFTGVTVFREETLRRWSRSAMLWFGFVVAVVATLQTFTSGGKIFWLFPSEYTDFVMGPILSHNHYAVFIEVVMPIAVYEALRRERDSLLYSGMAAAMFASVVASASRTGTVLVTAETVVVIVLMWARGRTSARSVGAALLKMAVLFAVFASVVGWESVWNRFWQSDPMQMRRELAISSLHMTAAHPWFGVGLGTWPTAYPRYAIVDFGVFANQAHSDWLQWAAEGGLPFGIAMLSLFLWCFRAAFRSVWGLGVVSVFLHAAVDYPFSRPALGSWVIVLVAILAAWNRAHGRQETPEAMPGYRPRGMSRRRGSGPSSSLPPAAQSAGTIPGSAWRE